jgi:serine/threonine-protein kinase RsbW
MGRRMNQQHVVVKNDLSELERVSHVVEAFGADHGIAPKVIFHLNLALDEILTNVISYAYGDGAAHDILVRLAVSAAEFTVAVEDDGRAFNPLDIAAPVLDAPLADRSIGGLGMYLVRQVVDRLEYRREQGKNVLVMKKVLEPNP